MSSEVVLLKKMDTGREGGLQLFLLRRLRQERRQRGCWVRPILLRRDQTGDVAAQNLSRSNTVCILQVHSPNRQILSPASPHCRSSGGAESTMQSELHVQNSRAKLRRVPPLRATTHNTHRQGKITLLPPRCPPVQSATLRTRLTSYPYRRKTFMFVFPSRKSLVDPNIWVKS